MGSWKIPGHVNTALPGCPGGKLQVPNNCTPALFPGLVPGGQTSRQLPAYPTVASRHWVVVAMTTEPLSHHSALTVSRWGCGFLLILRSHRGPKGSTGPPCEWVTLLLGLETSSQHSSLTPFLTRLCFFQGTDQSFCLLVIP